MDLKSMLPHRQSRAERVKQRGVELAERGTELAHDRKARAAAAAGVASAGAAVVAIAKARRSHGNGQAPEAGAQTDRDVGGPTSSEAPNVSDITGGAPGTPPGSGFEPHE